MRGEAAGGHALALSSFSEQSRNKQHSRQAARCTTVRAGDASHVTHPLRTLPESHGPLRPVDWPRLQTRRFPRQLGLLGNTKNSGSPSLQQHCAGKFWRCCLPQSPARPAPSPAQPLPCACSELGLSQGSMADEFCYNNEKLRRKRLVFPSKRFLSNAWGNWHPPAPW